LGDVVAALHEAFETELAEADGSDIDA
jgi:hypothetical protein